jgi:FemAB-related protein (PEP-CTERM system-associated)
VDLSGVSNFVVRRVAVKDLALWQDYVDRTPEAGCMHHAAWYEVLRDAFSVEPYFFLATDERSQVHGILPLYQSDSWITGRHIASLEEGVLSSCPQARRALLSAALELRERVGAKYLQIRGGTCNELATKVVPAVHTVIPTGRSREVLWRSIKKKTRWAIRQTLKQPITVVRDPDLAELDSFYKVYAEHMRELGTPVVGFDMFESIRARLGKDRLRLYVVKYRENVVGGMLCIVNSARWTDQYAMVRPSKQTEFANYLLYWHVICDANSCQVPQFDLGRCTPGSNVHLFKRKWGGIDIDVSYHFFATNASSITNPGLEGLKRRKGVAQRIWPHLPLFLCNRVGPLLRKRLPFI